MTKREDDLGGVIDGMLASYARDGRGHHIDKKYLPSRAEIFGIIDLLFQVFYPGYYGRQDLTKDNLRFHVETLIATLRSGAFTDGSRSRWGRRPASAGAGRPAWRAGARRR